MCMLVISLLLSFNLANAQVTNDSHSVLWLGTSIPAGCKYPKRVCTYFGWQYFNNAVGSSSFTPIVKHPSEFTYASGRRLCMTVEEIERFFENDVQQGLVSEEMLEEWKNNSFERRVIPYINGEKANCDIVVIDHGFNDRTKIVQTVSQLSNTNMSLSQEYDEIDRTNFASCFLFLYKKIKEINPNIQVIICSYLENISSEQPNAHYGQEIYATHKFISESLAIPFIDICDEIDFNFDYVPNTSTYISDINEQYNKNYVVYDWGGDNPEGNVTTFQYYCPDGVHPHTDPSKRAEDKITRAIVKKWQEIMQAQSIDYTCIETKEPVIYSISGTTKTSKKGLCLIDKKIVFIK